MRNWPVGLVFLRGLSSSTELAVAPRSLWRSNLFGELDWAQTKVLVLPHPVGPHTNVCRSVSVQPAVPENFFFVCGAIQKARGINFVGQIA